jgi:DNA primase
MGAETLIERLDHCKQTGDRKWMARCPSHLDNSPSLSIREGQDGRVLVHCFAGCGALDVISAVGLEWSDLFPEDLTQNYQQVVRRRTPSEQEQVDRLIIDIARADRANGKTQSEKDRKTELEAFKRLRARGVHVEREPVSDLVAEIAWEGWLRGRAQG